ncbi:LytTR family transcriptional regulator DNA-binding domain-containing protein [Streptococcus dentiloxodontae]
MNIYVLEDDLIQQTRIDTILKGLASEGLFSLKKLEVFSKPHKLLDSITEKGNHQVFLLDIDIDGETRKGLEVATKIRQQDRNAVIIFVTTHSEFAPISFRYKVSALDFIDKSVSDEQFRQELKQTLCFVNDNIGRQDIGEEMFIFETAQARVQVPMRDIYYFATSTTPHKVMLMTKDERLEFYANLGKIIAENDHLFSCHRSFLINLDNVYRVDKSELLVYFENGDSCPVSRLKLKNLLKKWSEHQTGSK